MKTRLEHPNPGESVMDACKRRSIGQVYFIHDEGAGAIKIGYTKDLEKRLRSLQTANPRVFLFLGSIPGSQGVERQIHEHFHRWRIRGEWFAGTDEVLVIVDSILQDGWPIP